VGSRQRRICFADWRSLLEKKREEADVHRFGEGNADQCPDPGKDNAEGTIDQ
jgi:hypothetical protein